MEIWQLSVLKIAEVSVLLYWSTEGNIPVAGDGERDGSTEGTDTVSPDT